LRAGYLSGSLRASRSSGQKLSLEFIEAKRADSAKRFGEHPTDRAVIAGSAEVHLKVAFSSNGGKLVARLMEVRSERASLNDFKT